MPTEPGHDELTSRIAWRCDEAVPSVVRTAGAELAAAFGASARAVIAYGSCIRDTDPTDGLLDLYVIVSDYRSAYARRWLGWANRCLPPNVFYTEFADGDEATVRVKYAVVSLNDFERGIRQALLPYLWGRFAQPVRLVWYRDERARERVLVSLKAAVLRLLAVTCPVSGDHVTADALWSHALGLSYATELRPEAPERARGIVARDAGYYRALTRAAVDSGHLALTPDLDGASYHNQAGRWACRSARLAWFARRWLGRLAAVGRLMKASLTFRGGVDYAAWKIERHTGEAVTVTPRLRRYPWIFGWGVLWRLLRRRLLG